MTIATPRIVSQRIQHWQAPNNAPLELKQEVADWLWEKWNIGELDIELPFDLKQDMVTLKKEKDVVFPSPQGKVLEEVDEFIHARGWTIRDGIERGIYRQVGQKQFDSMAWERLLFLLNIPMSGVDRYLRYEVMKLQGRIATNKANPKAKSPEVKAALAGYETAAANHAFNAIA